MPIGIRAEDLRKTYTSPPPTAAAGRGFGLRLGARRGQKQKYEVRRSTGCRSRSRRARSSVFWARTASCSERAFGQTQIGLMFSLVIAPMIFFGCAYYPWSSLATFPILQKVLLVNPIVYASEGFRSALVPRFPHLPKEWIFSALLAFDFLFLSFGLRQFRRKAVL